MIHIALRTEYSFRLCFGHLEQVIIQAKNRDEWALGIADKNNTFGHVKFEKLCNKYNIKPLFGVRLDVTDSLTKARSLRKSYNYISEFIFIAKNSDGLIELNHLINTAYDNFYYIPRLLPQNVLEISENIAILADYVPGNSQLLSMRVDFRYISSSTGYNPKTSKIFKEKRLIYVDNNNYLVPDDKGIYELMSYPNNSIQTYYQHVPTEEEIEIIGIPQHAINATEHLASEIEHINIKRAEMVKYDSKESLYTLCAKGAIKRGVDLDLYEYNDRLEMELELIEKRNFTDYFFIVSDLIKTAKQKYLIGPGRGSSGGSLVCYLLEITEIDPIKYGLLFERFIDINRSDLPDIDTDVPDAHRQKIIKYLTDKYGENNVKSIGTISTYKPKSAITDCAKALAIPAYATTELKDAIVERSGGDARANLCMKDTFEETEAGRQFIGKFPEMEIVYNLEGHARHSGKHAAGVIVSNDALYNYGGIDSKESIIMMDGIEAESIGLLKIDVLGLRTLSVLEETARLGGFSYQDYYKLELNDKKVFDIFNNNRLYGIFQFEGHTLRMVTNQIRVTSFNDICDLTSLGRPGALNSGGTNRYIKRKNAESEIESYGKIYDEITQDTYGITIYQEQTMKILRDFGNMSWDDVNILRRAMSKSYGDEFFGKYKEKFIKGGIENGYSEEESEEVWNAVASMGSYGFNMSHALGYSMISYWTAWAKTYYPLEFAAANLIHAKNDESAVKILRDFVVNDKIEYVAVDPDLSDINWSIHDNKLIGGLINLDGIGIKKAQQIIKTRAEGGSYTPAIAKKLLNPITKFDIIFPTEHYFGDLYKNPNNYGLNKPPTRIAEITESGTYVVIGKLIERDLRDRNDVQSVIKRGGEKVTENQFYLNLVIEDDTDSIKCNIPPFRFDELKGQHIAETFIPEKTWVMVKGKVREGWHSISIEKIIDIGKTLGIKYD